MAPADDDARRTSADMSPGNAPDVSLGSVFGTVVDADRYDRLRPGYPPAAVDWLLGSPGRQLRVLDLAAGTGKLTRALVGLGHEVVAVDPSEPMLAALRRRLADAADTDGAGGPVEALVGSAEDVPLPDASVDAVVVGQAWHWMRPAAAVAQVRRVLRPGGVLGLAWNVRDVREPWAAELEELLRGGRPELAEDMTGGDVWPRVPGGDAVRERAGFPAEQRLADAQELVDLATTFSMVAVSTERDALLERVHALASRAAAPDGSVVVPLLCRCFRYRFA